MSINYCEQINPKNMTYKQSEIINYAIKIANKSTMTHQHAAIIVNNRGEVLGEGFNKPNNNLTNIYSIHAECACIKNSIKKNKHKLGMYDLTLYVIRISYINNFCYLRFSKPCANCIKVIDKYAQKYKLRTIYYSIDEFELDNIIYKS
jgi:hypothetical protein